MLTERNMPRFKLADEQIKSTAAEIDSVKTYSVLIREYTSDLTCGDPKTHGEYPSPSVQFSDGFVPGVCIPTPCNSFEKQSIRAMRGQTLITKWRADSGIETRIKTAVDPTSTRYRPARFPRRKRVRSLEDAAREVAGLSTSARIVIKSSRTFLGNGWRSQHS